ncbi:MAG: fasciclin domain-containing protein [Bacteroidota bacterium]
MQTRKKAIRISFLLCLVLSFSNMQAQTVIEKLKSNSQTTEFADALENSEVADRLNESGPFTLFAPSNSAFANLSSGQQSDSNLLLNHILTGMATERSLRAMSDITSLSGKKITLQNQNGDNLSVANNQISTSNIRADNGIIHIIDGIIE